jgi:hypothetical protein
VDVAADAGLYTYHAAATARPDAAIVALEPIVTSSMTICNSTVAQMPVRSMWRRAMRRRYRSSWREASQLAGSEAQRSLPDPVPNARER